MDAAYREVKGAEALVQQGWASATQTGAARDFFKVKLRNYLIYSKERYIVWGKF